MLTEVEDWSQIDRLLLVLSKIHWIELRILHWRYFVWIVQFQIPQSVVWATHLVGSDQPNHGLAHFLGQLLKYSQHDYCHDLLAQLFCQPLLHQQSEDVLWHDLVQFTASDQHRLNEFKLWRRLFPYALRLSGADLLQHWEIALSIVCGFGSLPQLVQEMKTLMEAQRTRRLLLLVLCSWLSQSHLRLCFVVHFHPKVCSYSRQVHFRFLHLPPWLSLAHRIVCYCAKAEHVCKVSGLLNRLLFTVRRLPHPHCRCHHPSQLPAIVWN